jgi:hypothetical protein
MRDVQDALAADGFAPQIRPLPWYLKPPEWILAAFARTILPGVTPKDPRMIVGNRDRLAVVVQPADIVISAKKGTAMRARATLTTRMPFTEAYLTWEEASRKIEDRVEELWRQYRDADPARLGEILQALEGLKDEINGLDVPFEQWAVVYREALQLEEALVVTPLRQGRLPQEPVPEGTPAPSLIALARGAESLGRLLGAAWGRAWGR